jgi:hypothetical protein
MTGSHAKHIAMMQNRISARSRSMAKKILLWFCSLYLFVGHVMKPRIIIVSILSTCFGTLIFRVHGADAGPVQFVNQDPAKIRT